MAKKLGLTLVGGYAGAALVLVGPDAAVAQAPLAAPNPQQERCIEAFADTPEETAMKAAIGEPPEDVRKEMMNTEGLEGLGALARWQENRLIEVFGSEEAARAAGEKIRIDKYTRRLKLLREAANAGHLPSLYRLVQTSGHREYEGFPGAMGPEEKESALRTLYEYNFPLVPQILGGQCLDELEDIREPTLAPDPRPGCTIRSLYVDPGPYGPPNAPPPDFCTEEELAKWSARRAAHRAAYETEKARYATEIAERREKCLDLIREGGFRGHMYAWERLASYDLTTGVPEVGIVPPVEHYAWLELEAVTWRERDWEDQHNVPMMHQQSLKDEFLSEEQLVEAVSLARKYAEVLWPRRIDVLKADTCQLQPQFAGDPDPYASNLLPH